MDAPKQNLITGLVGIAILLIGVLIYAQFNAAQNFDLPEHAQQTE